MNRVLRVIGIVGMTLGLGVSAVGFLLELWADQWSVGFPLFWTGWLAFMLSGILWANTS